MNVLNNLLMGLESNSNLGCAAVRATVTRVFQTGANRILEGSQNPSNNSGLIIVRRLRGFHPVEGRLPPEHCILLPDREESSL